MRIRRCGFGLIGLATALISSGLFGQEPSGTEIVKKMDELLRGESSYTKMKMTLTNPDWNNPRELTLYAYELTKEQKSFIRITYPARDKGTGFLKVGYNLWLYVPATEKVTKIPPSMMHQSWMGSDFTNDDLVKESSIVNDYEHKLLDTIQDPANGKVYQLELIPKPSAQVVWGKILVWVRAEGYVPLKQQYFDDQGRMASEMLFSEIKNLGGRIIPTVWEMRPADKPGHQTIIRLLDAQFNQEIDPAIFTEKNLKSKNY